MRLSPRQLGWLLMVSTMLCVFIAFVLFENKIQLIVIITLLFLLYFVLKFSLLKKTYKK